MLPTLDAPTVPQLCDTLLATSSALATLMRQVSDPTPNAVGVWSLGETAAHVSRSAIYFLGAASGDGALERLGELGPASTQMLARDRERDPRNLADRLESGERALVEFAQGVLGDPPVHPFEGVEVPLSTLLGIELGELLVHGFDIAHAAGLKWHIESTAALMTLRAYLPMFPHTLDPARAHGVKLALEIRIRGMPPVFVSIADDRLTVTATSAGPVDAHIGVTPVAYLLLMWNRIPAWKPMLHGQFVLWGRSPWRAAELGALMLT